MAEPNGLLDSDVLIDILRGSPRAAEWLTSNPSSTLGIPVLVHMEVLQGARNRSEQQTLTRELSRYSIIHLTLGDTERALAWFEAYRLSYGIGIIDCGRRTAGHAALHAEH